MVSRRAQWKERAAAVLVMAAAVACAGAVCVSTSGRAQSNKPGKTGNREVTARVGEAVFVSFDIYGGSGHAWEPEMPLPVGIELGETQFSSIAGEKPGGLSRQTIVLRATRPGSAEITLIFRRVWIPATPSDPRFIIKVIATE